MLGENTVQYIGYTQDEQERLIFLPEYPRKRTSASVRSSPEFVESDAGIAGSSQQANRKI